MVRSAVSIKAGIPLPSDRSLTVLCRPVEVFALIIDRNTKAPDPHQNAANAATYHMVGAHIMSQQGIPSISIAGHSAI